MIEKNELKVSVRNLVEFVLRSGNLDSRFTGSSRALEGTKLHQKIQKKKKDELSLIKSEYMAEVTLSHTTTYKDIDLVVEGRADGIIIEGDNIVIDEIKSVMRPLELLEEEYNPLHWAQAKCYAYIYAVQNKLEHIDVQLTYCQVETEGIKEFRRTYSIKELESFFNDLINQYFVWAELARNWNEVRDESIRNLSFPFVKYRKGQRELAVAVYKTISENKKIFVQAPTGTGKTMSTLFPAVKALGEGKIEKIFYLTAKTITRQVAEETLCKMKEKGLKLKTLTLTAKDKICFRKECSCNPEQCEYARGHFDRVNAALIDILNNENSFTREVIEEYSMKYGICPFEFSLDLTMWMDCVICDYNYAFDPRVYLKRFFLDNSGKYGFLIDESHNLVDRAREMFSAELFKKPVLELKRMMKDKEPKISKVLAKLNTHMVSLKKLCGENENHIVKEAPEELYKILRKFINESEQWLVKNDKNEGHEELLDLYFNSLAFLRISELYDERYVTYVEKRGEDLAVKLFCLDPSYLLKEAVKRGKSAVFFSATLTPMSYFREILGGSEEDYVMRLTSPFSSDNMCLIVADRVSTKYKNREQSYEAIADYIQAVTSSKKGNYLVFFPSYKYMKDFLEILTEKYPGMSIIVQSNTMDEEQKEMFLKKFQPDSEETLVGFAVLGGIFSEGIDLKGERLIGAIIVGVGLPQICLERDIIMDYFRDKNDFGYEFAYMFPGMNKVLQAAGRVIRSEEDRGSILLIDERFSQKNYQRLFPAEWLHSHIVDNTSEVVNVLKKFW